MSFADRLWSVIAPAHGLKTITDVLETNSTHTGIAYAQFTSLHTCDYMSCVIRVFDAARSSKITVITYAKIRKVLTSREVVGL